MSMTMVQKSAYALGRRPARDLFHKRGEVILSVVQCLAGTPRAWHMYVEVPTGSKPGPSVLYRVRVRKKGARNAPARHATTTLGRRDSTPGAVAMSMTIEQRVWVEVNTDPQRRCYYGVHAKSEWQWTAWSDLESGISPDRVEARLEFWRDLNAYAVQERGQEAKKEFRVKGRPRAPVAHDDRDR